LIDIKIVAYYSYAMPKPSETNKPPTKVKENPNPGRWMDDDNILSLPADFYERTAEPLEEITSSNRQPPQNRRRIASSIWKGTKGARDHISKLTKHFVVTLFLNVLVAIMHYFLIYVGDPKFFDLIPIRYVIDLGDMFIIMTFVIIAIKEFWNMESHD